MAQIKSDELETFANNLLEEQLEATGNNVPVEIKATLKEDLLARIEDKINATILAHLPPEKLPDFEKLLDSSSDEEIQNFCINAIPNFTNIIASTLIDFRKMYLSI